MLADRVPSASLRAGLAVGNARGDAGYEHAQPNVTLSSCHLTKIAMSMRRVLIAGGLTAALIAIAMVPSIGAQQPVPQRAPTATPTLPVDLLKNGGFEGAFARQWNAANNAWVNGRVAEGWTAWWRKPTAIDGKYPGRCPEDDEACQPWHEPEYRETKGIPYTPPRIRSGDNSQMVFTSFGVHEGGLYQRVSGVPKGWRVRFSIWVRAWSRDDTRDTSQSSGQPGLHMRIGIDPTGGVDPWSEAVSWSEEFDSFDEFSQASIEVTAQAEALTAFFRSMPERALKHIDVMLDDAELIAIGPPPPTPVIIDSPNDVAGAPTRNAPTGKTVAHIVQSGDTLFAIAQQYRADLAAIYLLNGLNENSVLKVGQSIVIPLPVESPPTAVPTALPPEPAPVGALCVSAFEDAAGDGHYSLGDAPLRGAAFVVADGSGATVAATISGRCFDDLPVGAYAVSAQVPAGYLATTETRWGVALIENERVDVVVGGQRIEESAAGAGDTPSVQPIAIGAGSIIFLAAVAAVLRRRARRYTDKRA